MPTREARADTVTQALKTESGWCGDLLSMRACAHACAKDFARQLFPVVKERARHFRQGVDDSLAEQALGASLL